MALTGFTRGRFAELFSVILSAFLVASGISITLDPETARLLNTVLNIVSPLLIAYVAIRVKDARKKIEEVKEQTKSLSEWDGSERREDQEE